MSTTNDTGRAGITLVTTYVCGEDKQAEIITELDRAVTDVFHRQPGFISATLHGSLDRTRVLLYAQWERVEDFDAAGQVPEVQDRVAQIMTLVESADPRLYEVCVVRSA